MCGILGVASQYPVKDRSPIDRGCESLHHRGPDDGGSWWSPDGRVGLAHRRLAIIDLSAAGHQPMSDKTGELQIVFNGEIYNFVDLRRELAEKGHSFTSQSDTEVLLAAYREWGLDCLQRLNGMFALCIHDSVNRRVLLARDRAGEKPLFYSLVNGVLRFASELKALMIDPTMEKRLEPAALDGYLAHGFVPGDLCMLKGVNKLPAAHALTHELESGSTQVWRYWHVPTLDGPKTTSDVELLEELDRLLEDAVRRQMVADVPVGVLLSGGVDSSLITAMAARATHDVRTFTVRFPGHGAYDEGPHAKRVAEYLGTRHTELVAEPATIELLPKLARQFDEPLGDSSMVPTYLVSRLVRDTCTVALGGDAADELFGGYTTYSRMQQQMRWRRLMPRPAKVAIGKSASLLPTGLRGRAYLRSLSLRDEEAWSGASIHFDASMRRMLAPVTRGLDMGLPEAYRQRLGVGLTMLQKMTTSDYGSYLTEDILVKVDRASMLASLEIRAPFLDYRLIEFAFGRVPDRLRATRSDRKILLKMLARKLLPPEFNLRRKQGFSIPLNAWFKGEWGAYLAGILRSAPAELYDPKAIAMLLREQKAGLANAQKLFNLAMVELWRREYSIQI